MTADVQHDVTSLRPGKRVRGDVALSYHSRRPETPAKATKIPEEETGFEKRSGGGPGGTSACIIM